MNFSAFNKPFLSLAHWLALCLLVASFWSGVNLALDNRPWLLAVLPWWPGMRAVPFWHLQAALGWLVLLVLWLLLRRPQPAVSTIAPADATASTPESTHRPSQPLGRTHKPLQRHWQVVRLLRYVLCGLFVSGALLYLWPTGFGSNTLRNSHLALLGLLLPLLMWHGLVEWQLGAWPRVRQLFLRTLIKQPGGATRVASSVGLCVLALIWAVDAWQAGQTLRVPKINAEMQIDGLPGEAVWQQANSMTIHTYYGAPYERSVPVEIKMLHDGYTLYVLARWPDSTRSRQHLPLIKTARGWQVQQSGLLAADEQVYYEDKFAVMIGDEPWAALKSIFLGGPRVDGKLAGLRNPAETGNQVHTSGQVRSPDPVISSNPANSGISAAPTSAAPLARPRGGHLMPKGEMVDVWHWKSVRNHQFGNLDDAFFGDGLPYLPGQRRYTWGYASDPLTAGGYKENWAWMDEGIVTPLRLPRNSETLVAFQGKADNASPVLALDWHDSQPYSKALDTFPTGTVLPSVVWIHPNEGDRADVRANGVWRDGYWYLEMARGLDTGSRYDKKLHTGSFLWFATFDHNQTRHTWHMRPLRLELQP